MDSIRISIDSGHMPFSFSDVCRVFCQLLQNKIDMNRVEVNLVPSTVCRFLWMWLSCFLYKPTVLWFATYFVGCSSCLKILFSHRCLKSHILFQVKWNSSLTVLFMFFPLTSNIKSGYWITSGLPKELIYKTNSRDKRHTRQKQVTQNLNQPPPSTTCLCSSLLILCLSWLSLRLFCSTSSLSSRENEIGSAVIPFLSFMHN